MQRAARLLAALSRGPLAQAELAKVGKYRTENTEYAARMLRHDITLLRNLGFHIERQNTRPPVYTLNGWRVPPDAGRAAVEAWCERDEQRSAPCGTADRTHNAADSRPRVRA